MQRPPVAQCSLTLNWPCREIFGLELATHQPSSSMQASSATTASLGSMGPLKVAMPNRSTMVPAPQVMSCPPFPPALERGVPMMSSDGRSIILAFVAPCVFAFFKYTLGDRPGPAKIDGRRHPHRLLCTRHRLTDPSQPSERRRPSPPPLPTSSCSSCWSRPRLFLPAWSFNPGPNHNQTNYLLFAPTCAKVQLYTCLLRFDGGQSVLQLQAATKAVLETSLVGAIVARSGGGSRRLPSRTKNGPVPRTTMMPKKEDWLSDPE
jgi:hypothetical protein